MIATVGRNERRARFSNNCMFTYYLFQRILYYLISKISILSVFLLTFYDMRTGYMWRELEKYKWILRERKVNIRRACVRNVRNNEHSSIIKSIIDRFLYSVSSEEVAFISIIRVTICRHNRIMKYSYKYIYTMHKKLFFFNPELLIFKVYFFYLLLIFKLIFSTYLYSLISFWKIIQCVFPRIFENVRINESNIDTERQKV